MRRVACGLMSIVAAVAVAGAAKVANDGFLRLRLKVLEPFTYESSLMSTARFLEVSPGAKLSVPIAVT